MTANAPQRLKIILAGSGLLALAGWGLAAFLFLQNRDLGTQVSIAATDRGALAAELASIQENLKQQTAASGRLERLNQEIAAAQSALTEVTGQVSATTSDLNALQRDIFTGEAALTSLNRKIERTKAESRDLNADLSSRQAALDALRLRAIEETARAEAAQAGAAAQRDATIPDSQPAQAAAKPAAAKTEVVDVMAEARRRFQAADNNGDNKIDSAEFRLNKVAVLSLVDGNRDGYVTPDETLISGALYAEIDRNGDGRISQLEFIDERSFKALDHDGDDSITFEDYAAMLKGGSGN